MKITLNKALLNKRLSKAFEKTCDRLGSKMTEIIEREGGYTPPFPTGRDIVDTGALKESQSIERVTPFKTVFHYDTDYALYVHEGYTLRNGKMQPSRPWMWDGINELDIEKTFIEEFENNQ